jgi:hypothetical protein
MDNAHGVIWTIVGIMAIVALAVWLIPHFH